MQYRLIRTLPIARLMIRYRAFIFCALLALFCFTLHYSALVGGWRYDDPAHLFFAAQYSPWEYFSVPEVMLQQSWAHITPWNALFYDIGITLFGLNPMGHYAHQLSIIFLTSVAMFFLLQLWVNQWKAFAAAMLFLSMPATAVVGQLLMTGHYAYGLLFSILAIYTFILSLRHQHLGYAIASAAFYGLACWCKELYVPLIGVLLFLPEARWPLRLYTLIPSVVVAAIYTTLRLTIIGVGGYSQPINLSELDIFRILHDLKLGLFGNGHIATVSALSVGVFFLIALSKRCRSYPLLFLGSLFVLAFLPIFSMLLGGLENVTLLRLFYFCSWILAVSIVFLLRSTIADVTFITLLVGLFAFAQIEIRQQVSVPATLMEKQSQFILTGLKSNHLLPEKFQKLNYLESMRQARKLISGETAPKLINNPDSFSKLNTETASIFHYNDDCQCIAPVDAEHHKNMSEAYLDKLIRGTGRKLNVFLEVEDFGAQKVLRWRFSGTDGGYTLNILEFGAMQLPPHGEYSYGLDVTGPVQKQLTAYVHVLAKDGAIVRSPLFTLSSSHSNQIDWSGASVTQW